MTASPSKKSKRDSSTADHAYRGRFAPTTNGPLHAGSLFTAVASFLDARKQGGHWFVRLDDLDTPRNDPDAPDQILHTLETHGLEWDEPVQRQSEHRDQYEAALAQLIDEGRIFYCTCSRKSLRDQPLYPGTCRQRTTPNGESAAVRLRVQEEFVEFADGACGTQTALGQQDFGDFIVWRRDGLPSYQIATAVDDGWDGTSDRPVTHVLRGNDLLSDTPRQIYLMQALGLTPPAFSHWPVLVDARGDKLSKQAGAQGVNDALASDNLTITLRQLGLSIEPDLAQAPPAQQLKWALTQWPATTVHSAHAHIPAGVC